MECELPDAFRDAKILESIKQMLKPNLFKQFYNIY